MAKYSKKFKQSAIISALLLISLNEARLEIRGYSNNTALDEIILFGANVGTFDGIELIGSDEFISKNKEALSYLRQKDPEDYASVKASISGVRYHQRVLGFLIRKTGVHLKTRFFDIGRSSLEEDKIKYASKLVHEAYHVHLFRNGQPYNNEAGERACLEKQNQFLIKAQHTLLDVEQELNTRYWEKTERDW